MNAGKIDFFKSKCILKWGYIVETILILVGIVLRLKLYLSNPSFFIDECSLGANVIDRNYSELFSPLNFCQCAPPFFLIISKFIFNLSHQYGNIYTQDFVLRAFPLFCSIMSLPLFAIFLNKITDNKIFVWVCVTMLSLNTCAINFSSQFKQYSTELMVSLVLLLIFHFFDIYKFSKKIISIYSFIFCVSIWFSNTAIIILTTGFLYFILKCFSSSFRNEVKANSSKIAIIATSFIINLVIYYFYFKGIQNSYLYEYMLESWQNSYPSFFNFGNFLSLFALRTKGLIEIICIPYSFTSKLNVFTLCNLIILIFINRDFKFKTKFFILTPILLSIIASFLHIYPFERRLVLFLLPLFIILFCQFVFLIKPNKIFKTLTILALVAISIFQLNISINSIYYLHFKQPVRNTAEFIIQKKIPTNKIIFATNYIPYYLHFYMKDKNILLFDSYWANFKESKIPQTLKEIALGDYYIFTPYIKTFNDYHKELIKYLNYDKHIKIVNTYTYDGVMYIVHFEKISNY